MNFIKELVADALNGFTLSEIPFLVFRIFMAGAMGYALFLLAKKARPEESKEAKLFPAIAMFCALISICVEFSLPLAIVFLPVVLLINPFNRDKSLMYNLILAMCAGVGLASGAGFVFVAILGMVLITPVLWLNK